MVRKNKGRERTELSTNGLGVCLAPLLDAAHAGIERDLDAGALAGVEQARVGVLFRGAVRFPTLFVFIVIIVVGVAGRGGARGGRGGAAGRRDGLLELGGSQTLLLLLLLAAAAREGRGDLLEGDDLDRALLAEVALVRRGAARAEAGGGVLGVLRPVCICAVGGARVVGVCGAVEGGGAAHGGCGCGLGIGVVVHRVVVVWAVSVGGAEVWAGWEDEDGRAGAGGVVRVHPFLSGIEEEEKRRRDI